MAILHTILLVSARSKNVDVIRRKYITRYGFTNRTMILQLHKFIIILFFHVAVETQI